MNPVLTVIRLDSAKYVLVDAFDFLDYEKHESANRSFFCYVFSKMEGEQLFIRKLSRTTLDHNFELIALMIILELNIRVCSQGSDDTASDTPVRKDLCCK